MLLVLTGDVKQARKNLVMVRIRLLVEEYQVMEGYRTCHEGFCNVNDFVQIQVVCFKNRAGDVDKRDAAFLLFFPGIYCL